MDIFPDWLGQTGGAGMPYPVLVQGLDLQLAESSVTLVIDDAPLNLVLDEDALGLVLTGGDGVAIVVNEHDLDLEVDGA